MYNEQFCKLRPLVVVQKRNTKKNFFNAIDFSAEDF